MSFERFAVVRVPFPFTDRTAKNGPALVLKLFTLDHRLVRGEVGRLSPDDEPSVRAALERLFGEMI